MKIIPLKEGNFSTNKTKDFTLLTEENKDTIKGIRMSVTPFLVVTEKDSILLDAGIGWKNEDGKTVISEILRTKSPLKLSAVILRLCRYFGLKKAMKRFFTAQTIFRNSLTSNIILLTKAISTEKER